MVQSKAKTVADYLKELPPERRKVIAAVRKLIKSRLPAGYEEAMGYGMIVYQVPLSRFPKTYNGQPLVYGGLAAQKNNYSLYMMCLYGSAELKSRLQDALKKSGKKLDISKGCIRFKRVEDLPLEAIGHLISAVPMKKYLAIYEQSRAGRRPVK